MAQALKDYWDEHGKFQTGAKTEEFVKKRLEESEIIHLYVSQVTQGQINKLVRQAQEVGYSNGSIRKDLEHLRAALNHEVREQRLLYCPKFKLPERPKARERILSLDEIASAQEHTKSEHVENTIILMLNTGQRPAAVATLTWFQVDFQERIIHFQRNGRRISNKRIRPVRMNDVVFELLTHLYSIRTTEFVIEQVFKNKDGKVTKTRPAGNIRHGLKSAFKRAGIEDASRYTLRHTFANLCDTDDKTRSDIMGHTDTKTTDWHYLKSNKDKQQKAMDGVGKLFEKTTQKLRRSKNDAK